MNVALIVRAWAELAYVDLVGLFGFSAIRRLVRRRALARLDATSTAIRDVDAVLEAVEAASVVYLKPVLCLQRSAVTTRLLRRRGIPADMIIGCHLRPFKAHAWVEVTGTIVGIQSDEIVYYNVLDRW